MVVNKFLSLKFVEINEISSNETPPDTPGCPAPQRLPITDISQWIETLFVMVAILSQCFPEKAPELFAYMAHIVRCERNYQSHCWVAYDCCFSKEALVAKSCTGLFLTS